MLLSVDRSLFRANAYPNENVLFHVRSLQCRNGLCSYDTNLHDIRLWDFTLCHNRGTVMHVCVSDQGGQLSTKHTPHSSLSRFLTPYRAFLTFQNMSPYSHPEWCFDEDPLPHMCIISLPFMPITWTLTAHLFPQPPLWLTPKTPCNHLDPATDSNINQGKKDPPPHTLEKTWAWWMSWPPGISGKCNILFCR